MAKTFRINLWLVVLVAVALGVVIVSVTARGGVARGELEALGSNQTTAVDSPTVEVMAPLEVVDPRVAIEGEVEPSLKGEVSEPDQLPTRAEFHFTSTFDEPPHIPDAVFESMYGSMTIEELASQQAILELEHTREMERVAQERYDAGLYEEYIVENPQDPEGELDLPAWPYHKGLARGQRTSSLPDGRVQVWRTIIPYEENPEYYAKKDELGWLNRQIYSLSKQ